jgi:hypothetical protein
MQMFEQRLLPLFLLMKDLNSVLELCKPCSLSFCMLPSGFGTLNCCLPRHDGFLFLMEPLNLLLDSEQLLFYSFIFEGFFLPVLYLDLFELNISFDDLYWRRCPRGQLMRGTSVGLG